MRARERSEAVVAKARPGKMVASKCVLLAASLVVVLRSCAASNTTLWDTLVGECRTASFSCVSSNLHRNLEAALDSDLLVTDNIVFKKNANKYSWERNQRSQKIEEEPGFEEWVNSVEQAEADYEGVSKAEPPVSEPRSIGGVSDILYNKGLHYLMTHDLELGLPRLIFGGGTVKLSPMSIEEDGSAIVKIKFQEPPEEPRPEGRIFLKKIRQIFKKKLMTSFMAAMLIIKLVKVKLMFLLPLIVGVSTAKKILLKALLFLFPALAHLFKLCAYYHHQHTKFHLHHHHQVAHHHHHTPPVYYSSHYPEYAHPPPGAEIVHRSENELSSWGIEYEEPPISRVYNTKGAAGTLPNSYPAVLPPAAVQPSPPVAALPPALPPLASAPVAGTLVAVPQDTFYTPILKRLDRVFGELGFTEEPCKERLVCSMYKAPARFSPHSNLVSAEISRDPSELEKPVFSNPAVIRFYRYVEAARSGQEGNDCLKLFPHCSLLTE